MSGDIQKAAALPDSGTKSDLHDLVDNATIRNGVITNAHISATAAIASSKLADFSSQTAGDILYSDGTNWKPLAIGTANQVLTVNSGATAPEWKASASGAKDAITRGFELAYSTTTAVIVNAGTLYHGTTQVNKTSNTTLTLSTAGDWYDGSTHSYSGGAGWCYIGVDSSGNIKFLYTNAPDKADTSGNTDGTKLYWYDTGNTKYWRVIGAVRVNTSDEIAYKFYQVGSFIQYNGFQSALSGGTATTYTDIDLSDYIPAFATRAYIFLTSADAGDVYIRTNGATVDHWVFDGAQTAVKLGDTFWIITDDSQIVEYKNQYDTGGTNIKVVGYSIENIK